MSKNKKHKPLTAWDALNGLVMSTNAVVKLFDHNDERIKKLLQAQQEFARLYEPMASFMKEWAKLNRKLQDILKPPMLLSSIQLPKIIEPKSLEVLNRLSAIRFDTIRPVDLVSKTEKATEKYIRDLEKLVEYLKKKIGEQDQTVKNLQEYIKFLENYIKMLRDKRNIGYIQ